MIAKHPDYYFLITHPRSASNLFLKILNLDEQPKLLSYKDEESFFLHVGILCQRLGLKSKPVTEWTQGERDTIRQNYQAAIEKFDAYLQNAVTQGKDAFVKEHAAFLAEPLTETRFSFGETTEDEAPWILSLPSMDGDTTVSTTNKTILPDELLKIFRPTFLIRHPALAFPSLLRATSEVEGEKGKMEDDKIHDNLMTLHWNRLMYDFYTQHFKTCESQTSNGVTWPLLLDADDFISDPALILRYSDIVGLEREKLRFTWQRSSEEVCEMRDIGQKRFRSTLDASSEIRKDKIAGEVDVDAEVEKWKAEFGDSLAGKLKRLVEAAMDDYNYLKAKRLRTES